jgi:hypothetical protein
VKVMVEEFIVEQSMFNKEIMNKLENLNGS